MKPTSSKRYGQAFSFKKRIGQGLHKGNKKKVKSLRKGEIVDNEIAQLQQKIDSGIDLDKVENFSDFPLSKKTLAGLKHGKYSRPTEIQKQAIWGALQGKDILGAAKTGSGKTLAFLVPVLELLYKCKMSPTFGMAALIITPTRELAFQIFEVLNKIRSHHDFSANLIIGGKHLWREIDLMRTTNIVICTPGRLLHHLDQTHQFNADEVRILVLDEADRIMDSKFAKDMDNIIQHLPVERQTLLFSATQTKSVKALARLSLKHPVYLSVHQHAQYSTPSGLEQSYIVCELQDKLSFLFSFLKSHPNSKILVFLHTCKQVRFVHAVMRKERPGMTVLQLYGRLNQLRRIDVYKEFCRKQHVILFATDIACRGLDFPGVNWVVQLDCPVDAATYIHRAGRTARFEQNGQALLVLLPSEEEHMVEELRAKKIPINKIRVNSKFQRNITGSVAAACAENQELKEMAERAYRNYVFSISTMKSKQVFDVSKLNLELFAKSLGLFKAPRLRFLERQNKALKQKLQQQTDSKDSSVFGTKDISKDHSDSEDSSDLDQQENDNSHSHHHGDGSCSMDNVNSETGKKLAKVKNKVKKSRFGHREVNNSGSSGDSDSDGSDSGGSDSHGSDSGGSDSNGSDSGGSDSDGRDSGGSEECERTGGKNKTCDTEHSDDSGDVDVDKAQMSSGPLARDDVAAESEDDTEDLFTLKSSSFKPNRTQQIEEEAVDSHARTPKKKSLTKAAQARRLVKKGITANTRLTFDDDGNVIYNLHKRRKEEEDDDEDDDGGINIAQAAKRLRTEDQVDKALERERVKQKHREERIKKKKKKRAQHATETEDEEEPEVILNSVDEADDPFQYIPDPDQLKGDEEDSEDDSGDVWSSGLDKANSEDEVDQESRSVLEDTALKLLQLNGREREKRERKAKKV